MPTAATASPATETAKLTFALGLGSRSTAIFPAILLSGHGRIDRLGLADVRAVIESLPVRSVNLGTGREWPASGVRRDCRLPLVAALKLTMTSNGYSVSVLSDEQLKKFSDIEFSLDYPTQQEQDAQRGGGYWDLIHTRRPRGLDATSRRTRDLHRRHDAVQLRSPRPQIAEWASRYGAPLRVNVYQSVKSDAFALITRNTGAPSSAFSPRPMLSP